MPKDSTIELESSNAWLAAYLSISLGKLEEGETTIRKLQIDLGLKNYERAKFVMEKLVKGGKAEMVARRMLSQDGRRAALTSVYRLTNGKS